MDILDSLPELAKGGAWLLLAGVLVWIIKKSMEKSDAQDEAHRTERKEQSDQHKAEMKILMDAHTAERKEWVGEIKAAANATALQGEKIATAIAAALRNGRS